MWHPKVVNEDVPLSLWMQMFAIPDHENMVPKLQEQLEEELARMTGASVKLTSQPSTGSDSPSKQAQIQPVTSGGFAQLGHGDRRWGPSRAANAHGQRQAQASSAGPIADLIDVSLDDAADHAAAPAKPQATQAADIDLLGEEFAKPQLGLISFDSVAAPAATAAPPGPAPGPVLQRTSADLGSLDFGLGAATTTTPGFEQKHAGPTPLAGFEQNAGPTLPAGQQSAFGFVSASPAQDPTPLAATGVIPTSGPAQGTAPMPATGTGSGPSAFGFIAANSPEPKLDLAALYSSSSAPAPGPGTDVKFAPLMGFEQQDAGPTLQQDRWSSCSTTCSQA
jgi:hypothetical protein